MYRRNRNAFGYICLGFFLISDIVVLSGYLTGEIPLRGLIITLAAPVILALIYAVWWVFSVGLTVLLSAPVYLLGFAMNLVDKIRGRKKS